MSHRTFDPRYFSESKWGREPKKHRGKGRKGKEDELIMDMVSLRYNQNQRYSCAGGTWINKHAILGRVRVGVATEIMKFKYQEEYTFGLPWWRSG